MGEFRMPSLGADMDEGRLVEWLVQPGDEVKRGDLLAVIDTPKASMDIEVFEDGVVDRLLVQPGVTVAVGTPLALIRAPGAAAPERPDGLAPAPGRVESPLVRRLAARQGVDLARLPGSGADGAITRRDVARAARRAPGPAAGAAPPAPPAGPPSPGGRRVPASPMARRRAAELGVELAALTGSGPGGSVTSRDVERAAGAGRPAAVPVQAQASRPAAMREAIAALMARSKREVPHYYLSTTVDLAGALAWLRETNLARPVSDRVVPAALILKAAALAARRCPELNGFWLDGGFHPSAAVHLGVAISLRGGGLVAPAIHDADTLGLSALMGRLRDVVSRARTGRLRRSEMADPTLTVTNLGDLGVESVYGVIYPPQVALVGVGRISERPWARDGMLGVRPAVTVTLSADHRASDGHDGARFLAAIDELLAKPEAL